MSAEIVQDLECRLGRYVLRRSLGQGGNGQVFLAWKDNAANEPLVCVVKFPLQRYARSSRDCERFLQEARLGMRLGAHPNVVHVTDVDHYYGMPIIVMQYVDGVDLHLLLKFVRGREVGLSLAAIYAIMGSVAAALHHAHSDATIDGRPVSIVHRDVKPANILVTRDGMVKLADFGIGVAMEDGTSGNFLRGSTRYMSPEHLSSVVSPKMDVYSLGAVAWEMVENRPFRESVSKAEIYAAIMDAEIPTMRSEVIPRVLADLIRSCLQPNPNRRPTANEVLKALKQCPGYRCDSSVLKHELVPLIGTARSSGASQEEPVATPELRATLAALRTELEADSHCTTAVRPAARKGARRRPVMRQAGGRVEDAGPEPDAPRVFRRSKHRRRTSVNHTVRLPSPLLHRVAEGSSFEDSREQRDDGSVESAPAFSTVTLVKAVSNKGPEQERGSGRAASPGVTGWVREAVVQPGLTILVVVSLLVSLLALVASMATALLFGASGDVPKVERTADPELTTGRAQ